MPITKRPGAASARLATDCAINAGPRVKAGMIATPSRAVGVQAAAWASGVKPSCPFASEDQNANSEIYIIPSTGGDPYNVSRHPDFDEDPVWSPDGKRLVWSSHRHDNDFRGNLDGCSCIDLSR